MTEQEAAAADATEEKSNEVTQMKKGDYMVHVMVEIVRQVKCPEGATLDPLCEVSLLNEKSYTTAKDDITGSTVITWNEHLFFEPKNLTVEQVEGAKIQIRLLDKGYFKDAMIGAYSFDLAYIYMMKDHAMLHQWIAMSDPASENFSEVTAYMKLSISVAAAGDEQIQIEAEPPGAGNDKVMMPPSIRPEFYQIKFKFFRAENLPSMDTALFGKGSLDAYVICEYMGQKLKTKVLTQKEGGSIDWNQEFLLPAQLPIMSSRIVMKLYDEDKIKDEIVGSMLFNLKEVIGKKNGLFFWKNIYGAPLGRMGDNVDAMNKNPEGASTWKGRILMQCEAVKTDKPKLTVEDIDPESENLVKASTYYGEHEYAMIAEVGQGIALPDNDKYTVKIVVGDNEWQTEKPLTQSGKYCRWNHRFEQNAIKTHYQDVYDMGRVYVYLMDGKNPVCFYKEHIKNFLNPNPKTKWIQFQPDLALGKVKEAHEAGIISIKIAFHDVTKDGAINFKDFDAWKKVPKKRMPVWTVRSYVFQARDLPAADANGTSDPFIVFHDMDEKKKKTRTIEDNCNPIFYETVEMQFEAETKEDLPPIVMDIYDADGMLDSDDYISRCMVLMKDAAISNDATIPRPKWHECKLSPKSPVEGELLISFSVVEMDFNFPHLAKNVDLTKEVATDEYNVSCQILGLRDLKSPGILPVKKAFINFNIKSMLPPSLGSAIKNVSTQPSALGPNPTINTLITFEAPLPGDELFCPKLSCQVFDNIFKGFGNQPLIGNFTIPIGKLMQDLKDERRTELAAINHIVEELQKIIDGEGVPSYDAKASINQSQALDEEIKDQQSAANKATRSSAKKVGNEDVKAGLLANMEEAPTFHDVRKTPTDKSNRKSTRVTPKDLAAGKGGKTPRTPGNAMKQTKVQKFNAEIKADLIAKVKEAKEQEARDHQQQMERDQAEFKNKNKKANKNVLWPTYAEDKRLAVMREVNPPPESLFIGLGYDIEPGTNEKKRHYRRYYKDELENITEVMPVKTPFHEFMLKQGQSRGASKGLLGNLFGGAPKTDDSGSITTEQEMGKFKGVITVESQKEKDEYNESKADLIHQLKTKMNQLSLKRVNKPLEMNLEMMDTAEGRSKFSQSTEEIGIGHLNVVKHLADLESDETLKRLLLGETKCIVRLYMISGFDLSSRDNGSQSDPYLVIQCGKKIYNERENYQEDEPNPTFFKSYDFEGVFPGCAPISIKAYDYDLIFGDDLIGETTIDLEDRFFMPEWQSIKHKPIEYRQIYHTSSACSQGQLKCWVEIIPTTIPLNEQKIFDITPKPAEQFEVRMVVWDTQDVIMADVEGTSDVYIRGFFDSKDDRETDTHFRCTTGKASFNYRLKFKIDDQRKNGYIMNVQVYDKDFFSANEVLGEATFNLAIPVEDCSLTGRPVTLNKKYVQEALKEDWKDIKWKDDTSFWLDCYKMNDKGEKVLGGRVRLSVDVFPWDKAEANEVGAARNEPNHSPFCPPPVGRISFSLNPFKMFMQLVGPSLRRKIYCACCCALCCALIIMLFPLIAGNLISAGIEKLFGLR